MRSHSVSLDRPISYIITAVSPTATLVAFIAGHCNDKLCLPCKLVLPSHDLGHVGSGNLSQSLLTSGAGM